VINSINSVPTKKEIKGNITQDKKQDICNNCLPEDEHNTRIKVQTGVQPGTER
jgi:hypothetical protein